MCRFGLEGQVVSQTNLESRAEKDHHMQPDRHILLILILSFVGFLLAVSDVQSAQYKLIVVEAQINAQKQLDDGPKSWDVGAGKPDPYVVVEIDGAAVFVSGNQADTHQPRWYTGTGYWHVSGSVPVRIVLRDADAAKGLARVGMAGVTVHPVLPDFGKQLLNDVLLDVDTDDPIAVWTGTLDQLIAACGGVGKAGDLVRDPEAADRFTTNFGLDSLTVRVIERPDDFDIGQPSASPSYLGLTAATIERVKRKTETAWDVGVGAFRNPDPRYLIYVNGEPILTGAINKDSFVATWGGELPALDLDAEDTIAIAILDADAGTLASKVGKHALLFSEGLSLKARQELFSELANASTDDLVFLWVGPWKTLKAKGERLSFPGTEPDPHIWVNDGLASATAITINPSAEAPLPAVDLVVKGATLKSTKADGKPWDAFNGQPDPFVRCFVAGAGGGWELLDTSEVVENSTTATWDLRLSDDRLTPERKVKFEVYDKDGASNDLIGTIVLTIPAQTGTHTESAEQIEVLELMIEQP